MSARLLQVLRSTRSVLSIAKRHVLKLLLFCRWRLQIGKYKISSSIPCRLYRLSNDDKPTYFGYYDKSPFSYDNEVILAAAMTVEEDCLPSASNFPLHLGYFLWSEVMEGISLFHQFGESDTWSWQQGCMLQWFPQDGIRLVTYNQLVEGKYGAVVQEIYHKQIVASYKKPIYSLDTSKRRAASLNFSRLERLRPGYGYMNLPDETENMVCPSSDGIWIIDLDSESFYLLLSLEKIARVDSAPSMLGAFHYFNHVVFSPGGRYIAFLHLWQPNVSHFSKRENRLVIYDLEKNTFAMLDSGAKTSHFSWITESKLVAFRVSHDGKTGYFTIDINSGWQCEPLISVGISRDGHPSPSPRGDLLVFDTYPNTIGDQEIFLYSFRKINTVRVGSFFSPPQYRGKMRCDLHPRWDRAGTRICFDSVHSGKRAMYILDLEDCVEE